MFKISSEVIRMANSISFEYNFGFPHSTPLVRSYELFKTMKEEYTSLVFIRTIFIRNKAEILQIY